LSSDFKALNKIKNRPFNKEVLRVLNSYNTLKKYTRIPNKYKNLIRKSKNISFIYPNKNSFRVVNTNSSHINFINKFKIMYSTSANEHNKIFDENFSKSKSDIIIYDNSDFNESNSSSIYRVSKNSIKRVR